MHHPLRQESADAGALADAQRRPAMHPIVAGTGRGTGQRRAVRCVRDCARDNTLDARLREQREALPRPFQMRHNAVQLRRDQLAIEIPGGWTIPTFVRASGLVRSDKDAVALFAEIGMRPGIPHHRQLRLVRDQLRYRFSDKVVMQHVGDRRAVAGPGSNLVAIGATGVHDMLAMQLALIGGHQPFAAVEPADVHHARAAADLGAKHACTGGHRHSGISGRDVAVGHGQEGRLHAFDIKERMMAGISFGPMICAS